jgi:2-deoxy-D-gluconate 3-dehydrogenase
MSNRINFDLTGKVMLVTGAGKGIGKAIALVCAEAGADLALGSRAVAESEETAAACRAFGRRAEAWPLDVAQVASVRHFVEQTLATFGRIDVLVNNAGINFVKPAIELSEAEFDAIAAVNFKGAFFASTLVAKSMIERGVKGTIINISSQVAHVGGPLRAAYTGTKGALNQLTKSFAAEWAEHGLTVNGVSPTFTRSPMLETAMKNPEFLKNLAKVPLGRPAEPEEIAAAVLYLASEPARIVTGHTILVDGGYTAI